MATVERALAEIGRCKRAAREAVAVSSGALARRFARLGIDWPAERERVRARLDAREASIILTGRPDHPAFSPEATMSKVHHVEAVLKGRAFSLAIPRNRIDHYHPHDPLVVLEERIGSLFLCLKRFAEGAWHSSDVTEVLREACPRPDRRAFAEAHADLSLLELAPLAALVVEAHLAGIAPERVRWPAVAAAPVAREEAA